MKQSTLAYLPARIPVCLSVLILLFGSCATKLPPPTEFAKAPLLGMAYDAQGTPVHNVEVSIDGENGPVSDINGRFVIPELSRGNHTVEVKKNGYEGTKVSFDFLNKSQILYLRLSTAQQLCDEAEKTVDAKDFPRGMELAERALKVDPQYAPATYMKAVIYYKQKDWEKSLAILKSLAEEGILFKEVLELGYSIAKEKMQNSETAEYFRNLMEAETP